MAVDPPRSTTFRRKIYPEYKAHRSKDKPPENVFVQMNRCRQIVRALGITVLECAGFEADDVIATLVEICSSDEVECVIFSRDKDLHQLIGPNCRQFDPQTEVWMDEKKVLDKWAVPPSKVVDVMTLSGDSTDNVPGVSGIGSAIATTLIKEYGSLKALSEAVDTGARNEPVKGGKRPSLTAVRRQKLKEADLDLCRQLVELRRDVPISLNIEDLEFNGLDFESARPLFEELGFDSILDRYL
jgi:5'-3' exonuclease